VKAEELVALASAHGVDLVQAARLTGRPADSGTVRVRGETGRYYQVLRARSGLEARGTSSPSFDRPAWSLAELGQAAAGVPQVHFMAACYALAGDRSVYWRLWDALHFTALRLRERNNWPKQVRGAEGVPRFYLEQLVQLVLDEDAHPHLFNSVTATDKHPSLHAIYLQVDEQTWRRAVFERFDAVKLRYLGWIEQAMRTMQPRLEDSDECAV
jgi:hypothetical protein